MGRPNQMHERLDALLDGHTGEVTDDLAPLLEAAESLRAELAQFELDPEVADRHLERVLNSPAPVVPLPVRGRGSGLRRRVAAVALAAALVLVPATMASAASSDALPGQTLYAVKLAVEQVRLAGVQWSASREAAERTRIADERVDELARLIALRRLTQIPPAILRVNRAVAAATKAVNEAMAEGADKSLVAKVFNQLKEVRQQRMVQLTTVMRQLPTTVPKETREAITVAVQQPAPPPLMPAAPPTPAAPTPAAPPVGPTTTNSPSAPPTPTAPQTPPSTPTEPQPEQTTTEPPETTAPPTTTAPPAGDDSGGAGMSDGAGKSEMGSAPSSGP
jgi:hypothetical protein